MSSDKNYIKSETARNVKNVKVHWIEIIIVTPAIFNEIFNNEDFKYVYNFIFNSDFSYDIANIGYFNTFEKIQNFTSSNKNILRCKKYLLEIIQYSFKKYDYSIVFD